MGLVRWTAQIHHICTCSLYIVFISMYFHEPLRAFEPRRNDFLLEGVSYDCRFLYRTRKLPKLDEPHSIPDPALIGAIALTIGIMLGYLYFIVFNYAFQSCDKLVDAIYSSELWLETIYDLVMASFSGLSLIYILHRRYYGAINSNLDKVGRLFINITFSVVWMKVVIYKGYLSHQELCQRKELEGYWCPVMKRNYDCSPYDDLHGTQKSWYYINKGLLSSSIISCASEFFPVLLVGHWLACGGAEEKAEDIERRMKRKAGVRGMLREFMKDISRVYVAHPAMQSPPLVIRKITVYFFWVIVPLASLASVLKWIIYFYYAIDFDELVAKHWVVNDYTSLVANVLQVFMFIGMWIFSITIADERLDAHHKAHARGDISILFGCCVVLLIKLVLQSTELEYQRKDGFINQTDAIVSTVNLATMQLSQWLQYFAIRRLLALSDRDCKATKSFLPLVGLGGLLIAWVHFGITFFATSLIKYELTDETFRFSSTTLICMIFTQTLFPADYLFAFTVSGCYLELLQRYLNFGFFQLGEPRMARHGSGHGSHGSPAEHEQENGHVPQGGLHSMMHAASIFHRKRMENLEDNTESTTSSVRSLRESKDIL
ncbi:unnamed protein product [Caenorhabditis auriculariae]|uniref:Uncharacterized protein n=1 Tax=Caenorhabditis auriculariae TaxID=2777116 RepID=A0A8S1H5M0_9PELO|nr:unnamed protein product [Caenorhabditis auriculariae]